MTPAGLAPVFSQINSRFKGVLRNNNNKAAVDLAKLTGKPSLRCHLEIMNDDGNDGERTRFTKF